MECKAIREEPNCRCMTSTQVAKGMERLQYRPSAGQWVHSLSAGAAG